jgi:hypothetical protein
MRDYLCAEGEEGELMRQRLYLTRSGYWLALCTVCIWEEEVAEWLDKNPQWNS